MVLWIYLLWTVSLKKYRAMIQLLSFHKCPFTTVVGFFFVCFGIVRFLIYIQSKTEVSHLTAACSYSSFSRCSTGHSPIEHLIPSHWLTGGNFSISLHFLLRPLRLPRRKKHKSNVKQNARVCFDSREHKIRSFLLQSVQLFSCLKRNPSTRISKPITNLT